MLTKYQLNPDEDDEFNLTVDKVFSPSCCDVLRSNYRRTWYGKNFVIRCGKFKGKLLSEVDSITWLQWALNHFESELDNDLKRALIDQYNSLFL